MSLKKGRQLADVCSKTIFHKAVFPLAKFITLTPATVTRDSHVTTCLGNLGWHDRDRNISIFCCIAQGGQGM